MKWCDRTLITSPLSYGLCLSEADYRRELKRLKLPRDVWPDFLLSSHANCTVHFFEQVGGIDACAIVCLGPTKGFSMVQVHSLFAHEAVHIWQAIREHIGEKHPSSEFEAYSIQSITQNLMTAYHQATGRGNK